MLNRPLFRPLVALVALLSLTTVAATASAQDKLDRALREASKSGKAQRVIFKSKSGYEAWARKLLTQNGKAVDAELPSVGSFAVELTAGEMDVICNSTVSDGCSSDATVTPSGAGRTVTTRRKAAGPRAQYSAPQVNTLLGTLGLAPNAFGGLGVTVAVIDSGIYPSDAFGNRIKAFYDFTDGGVRAAHPFDDYGHGTHVAGLIGALELRDLQYQGVAPSVQFVGLKVLDKTGAGKTSDVIRAIEFAIANRDVYSIDIINLSLGHPIFEPAASDPLVRAVEKATEAGIIVVVSAGNHGVDANGNLGFGGITSPGNAPSALTVGATDHHGTVTRDDDKVAAYSSAGPTWYDGLAKPDFVAPGHFLASESAPRSMLWKTYSMLRKKGQSKEFMQLSGTSMATAVVTGVVALLEQNTGGAMTPNLAKGVLQFTAIPLKENGELVNPLRQGRGQVNAKGALNLVNHIDATVTSFTESWLTGSVDKATTIGTQTYAWAGNIVWGNNIVWGDSVFYNLPIWGLNIVWGNNIVWGDNIVWGNNIVWGDDADNIVWGNNIVWGDNIVWGNDADNIVWGNNLVWGNNIVWGDNLLMPRDSSNADFDDDNIVWGNLDDDNVVWGNTDDDNVVWGNSDDNIVWGNRSALKGNNGKGSR